jgi:PAS domain S-box-containing protein
VAAGTDSRITDLERLRATGPKEPQAVAVRGVVTALSEWKNSFFLQDGTAGISVDRLDQTPVTVGDEVLVHGNLRPGLFAPLILSSSVTVMGKAPLPRPQTPSYEELADGSFDSRWIEVRGVVHSAQIETVWDRQVLLANVHIPGGSISVHILNYAGIALDALVDSTVTVRGVCGTKFNGHRQMIGLRLFVPEKAQLQIDVAAPDPARMAKAEISQVQQYSMQAGLRHRVKMTGTLTYQSAEHGLYLQENGAAIHVQTNRPETFRLGDRLEVLGFVRNFGYSPGLEDAQVRRLSAGAEVRPALAEPADVIAVQDGFQTTPYDGHLVKVTATVVEQIPNSQDQLWLLRRGGVLFQADLAGMDSPNQASFEPRSTVNIVGVCVAEIDDNGNPASFRLLLRSPADISVADSPYWTRSFFVLLAGFLLLLGGGLLAGVFEHRYLPEPSGVFTPKHVADLFSRFQYISGILSWLVFCVAVLNFAALPLGTTPPENRLGTAATSLVLAIAALAVYWDYCLARWKDYCSAVCASLVMAVGAGAFLPYWNKPPAPVLEAALRILHGIGSSTAVAFCLCISGAGLLLLRGRKLSSLAQLLFVAVGAVGLLNILTRLYGDSSSFGVARHTTMPLSMAVCFFGLSTAALLSRPASGLLNAISSPGLGGLLSRRLLPASLVIPALLGWVRLQGQLLGLYDTLFGLALFALSNVLSFGCLIWMSAAVLNRLDLARSQIEEVLRERDKRVDERAAELAESELLYLFLVEGIKDYAIFLLDAAGSVKSWNKGAEQLTGYKSYEILGRHFAAFYSPLDVAAGEPDRALAHAIAEGRFFQEGWRVRKDGSQYWAGVVTTTLLDEEGRLRGFSKIIRDMTEQREAESLLVAERQRAEHANQAKSNFLASMNHEIRTPMNSILGMADLLSETDLDDLQREYVERFQRAGSNLLAIINDLLDLSKIESGHFELEQVAFDLEDVAQRSLDLIAPKAQGNRVNLALRIAPDLKTAVIGDANRLQQILLNLLGNAAKFTESGEIVLNIGPHPDGAVNHIQFQVSDTGIGIREDKLSSIFDDFTQGESSISRRFGGTGLGLGIARRLVQRMGGALTVQSELGAGSAFTFDAFFRQGQDQRVDDQRLGGFDDLLNRRILIVDSGSANRLIYSELCSAWGMRPEVTASAVEAVALLSASLSAAPFSVILLDRFSADLDAFEAIGRLQKISPAIPVFLTTAEDYPGDATRAKTFGFTGYVVKPIRRASLLRLVSSSIRSAPLTRTTGESAIYGTHSNQGTSQPRVKVLAADDSEDNRFLIEAYLKGSCYELIFATNGERAIEQFKARPFDLILMDVQMPVLDGLRATAAIRDLERREGRPPIPIIALTANAMAVDVESSKAAGCNAHLAKPISKADLLKALGEWQAAPVGAGSRI